MLKENERSITLWQEKNIRSPDYLLVGNARSESPKRKEKLRRQPGFQQQKAEGEIKLVDYSE